MGMGRDRADESERFGLGAEPTKLSARVLLDFASSSNCLPPPGRALYGWRARSMGFEGGGGMGGLVSSMADSDGVLEYGLRSRSSWEGM